MTPMMEQYFEIKNQYKDYLVFYRLGDFYEMFFDDAIIASRELELTLTGRDCGEAERAPMCGVPFHSSEGYIGKLIEKGELKFATEKLYDFIQYANRYYDQSTPWVLAKNNIEEFNRVTSNCIYMIANMANLYEPILPKHAKMIKQLLGLKENLPWAPVEYDSSVVLKEVPIIFDRLDATKVDLSRGSGDTLNVKKNNEMSM